MAKVSAERRAANIQRAREKKEVFLKGIGIPFQKKRGGAAPFSPIQATGGIVQDVEINGVLHRVHVYLTSGTFSVANKGSSGEVKLLVVAGGGGGSLGSNYGGGGGAGGVIMQNVNVNEDDYELVVGAGGIGSTETGTQGDNSLALGLEAIGGGYGGPHNRHGGNDGGDGGSGGGGGYAGSDSATNWGEGIAGQGYRGAGGGNNAGDQENRSGGGGGASEPANGRDRPDGAPGIYIDWLDAAGYGDNGYVGGGGGGVIHRVFGSQPIGGLGGGGLGVRWGTQSTSQDIGTAGADNTGGGGGGGGGDTIESTGKDGGSGIIGIAYPLEN